MNDNGIQQPLKNFRNKLSISWILNWKKEIKERGFQLNESNLNTTESFTSFEITMFLNLFLIACQLIKEKTLVFGEDNCMQIKLFCLNPYSDSRKGVYFNVIKMFGTLGNE